MRRILVPKNLRAAILGFAALAFLVSANAAPQAEEWKAGAAKIQITPKQSMWMSGYGGRNKPSEGTLHDLWVKALVLEDPRRTRAVLLTADLVGIPKSLSDAICEEVGKKLGLGREAILIATSHTHTGPVVGSNLVSMFDLSAEEHSKIDAYARELKTNFVKAAEEAFGRLKPARLAWGNGTADFAVNRRNNPEAKVRELRASGQLKGPFDHEVPVLSVNAADGSLKAVVFGYACHNTVLSFYQWSGDYAGFAQIDLEKAHPEAVALFFAGCGADQNPLPRRTVDLAAAYGRTLADAVEQVLKTDLHPLTGPLSTSHSLLDVPFEKLPGRDEIQEKLKSSNVAERGRARLFLEEIKEKGALSPTYPYPIQVWQMGTGLTFVALGGEVVVDYSLRLKNELGAGRTWVAGYCNDVMAYIPSLRVLREGGYEGGGAMVYYGLPSAWGSMIEESIVGRVKELDAATKKRSSK